MTTLYATFDGQVIRPDEPIDLTPNTRLRVTIEPAEVKEPAKRPSSFIRTALSLQVEGPPDWSENIEKYLYGDGARGDNEPGRE
jgi:hypothetical protein